MDFHEVTLALSHSLHASFIIILLSHSAVETAVLPVNSGDSNRPGNWKGANHAEVITVRCPAKLNLFLEVGPRRPDGYHEIDTVMACVSLMDRLSFAVTEDGSVGLTSATGYERGFKSLPPPNENLITRTLTSFQREAHVSRGARLTLAKRIPTESGLGGASSNAAAALVLANRVWEVFWPIPRLSEFAATQGSDLPFFLQRQFAVCRGRGEKVTPQAGILAVPVVIVSPPIGFATPNVYREHRPTLHPRSSEPMLNALAAGDLRAVARSMFNRLQTAASKLSDWPERLRRFFDRLPTLGHQMTGSGSCYFGLFRMDPAANQAARRIRGEFPDCRVFVCKLISRPRI